MKKALYITTLSRTINAFLIPHIEMLLEMKERKFLLIKNITIK